MTKFRYAGAILLGLAVLGGSCATVEPLERLTSDDCLLVIPTVLRVSGGAQAGRTFVMGFDNQKAASVANLPVGYVLQTIRRPVKLVRVSSSVTEERMTGAASRNSFSLALPYEPSQVVIFDQVFVQSVSRPSDYQFLTSWGFEELTDELRSQVMERLRKDPHAASWMDVQVRGSSVTPPAAP